MHDERAVANYLLDQAELAGNAITHLSLQKLLFFAHAWHLAQFDRPLVLGTFQAWKFGPVLRTIFDSFRSAGKKPIKIRATRLDLTTGGYVICTEALSTEAQELLLAVMAAGANMPAWYLSELTHQPGSPWDSVWTKASEEINVGMRIPNDLIRQYFLTSASPLPRS
jgi:uncharacterized phage-associated protein